jgi:hypothetical protein
VTQWIAGGLIAAAVVGGVADGISQEVSVDQPAAQNAARDISRDEPASDTLEITAAHEAGHVAALREFGIPVWGVDIHEDGSGETVYPDHYFRDPARDAYDYAVTDVAGQESAAAWLVSHRGYTQERALAETETAAHYDLSLLREDAAHAGISEQEARQRARAVIQGHRSEIDSTARKIIARGGSLDKYDLDHELER